MNAILHDFSSPVVVTAIEANLCASFTEYRRVSTVEVHITSDLIWVDTGVPSPWYNGVFCNHVTTGRDDGTIAAALNHFNRQHRAAMWWTVSGSDTAGLSELLEAHGLKHRADLPGMAMDLQGLGDDLALPEGLKIVRVNDLEMLRQWTETASLGSCSSLDVARASYDLYARMGLGPEQPWRYYLGLLDGVSVSTASVCLLEGVAGLYSIATLPYARGRGLGTALTLSALHDARALGYRVALLQSTPMGYQVYRKLGFEQYCTFRCYA